MPARVVCPRANVVLVTGGSGFTGGVLVHQLVRKGRTVRVFDRVPFRSDDPDVQDQVETVLGDLKKPEDCERACDGVTGVIHVAAMVEWFEDIEDQLLAVNVGGTRNMLDAARKCGVERFIYTSSTAAVYELGRNYMNVSEDDVQYIPHRQWGYGHSKAMAEQTALQANGTQTSTGGTLAVAALRPCGQIYGPGSKAIVDGVQRGHLCAHFSTEYLCQQTYVENVAHAHVLALERMERDGSDTALAGQAYFVADDEGRHFSGFLEPVWHKMQWFPVRITLPLWVMLLVAYVLTIASFLTGLLGFPFRPEVTIPMARGLMAHNVASTAKAKRDFDWHPLVPRDEALSRVAKYLRTEIDSGRLRPLIPY